MAVHVLDMAEFDKVITETQEPLVKKVIQLFLACDDGMKSTALYATGFKGVVTAENLKTHFSKMSEDYLLSAIDDLEDDINYEKEKEAKMKNNKATAVKDKFMSSLLKEVEQTFINVPAMEIGDDMAYFTESHQTPPYLKAYLRALNLSSFSVSVVEMHEGMSYIKENDILVTPSYNGEEPRLGIFLDLGSADVSNLKFGFYRDFAKDLLAKTATKSDSVISGMMHSSLLEKMDVTKDSNGRRVICEKFASKHCDHVNAKLADKALITGVLDLHFEDGVLPPTYKMVVSTFNDFVLTNRIA